MEEVESSAVINVPFLVESGLYAALSVPGKDIAAQAAEQAQA